MFCKVRSWVTGRGLYRSCSPITASRWSRTPKNSRSLRVVPHQRITAGYVEQGGAAGDRAGRVRHFRAVLLHLLICARPVALLAACHKDSVQRKIKRAELKD